MSSQNEDSIVSFEEHGPIVLARTHTASVLDAMNVSQFGEALMAYVQPRPGIQLLLDFKSVDYLSSAVLTELLRINKTVSDTKGSLRLSSLNSDIARVFEITNLDKMFIIYDSDEDGLRKFKRSLEIEAAEDAWDKL